VIVKSAGLKPIFATVEQTAHYAVFSDVIDAGRIAEFVDLRLLSYAENPLSDDTRLRDEIRKSEAQGKSTDHSMRQIMRCQLF